MSDIKVENMYVCNYLPTQPGAVQWFRYYCFQEYLRKYKDSRIDFQNPKIDFLAKGNYYEMNMHTERGAEYLFDSWLTKVCTDSDVVIAQRVISPAGLSILQTMKEDCKIKIITEIDDNFEIQPYQEASQYYSRGSAATEVFKEQLSMSDAIIVTQDMLKNKYSKYCDNILVLPNGIAEDSMVIKDNLPNIPGIQKKLDDTGVIRILWAGSSTHKKDLEMVYPDLLKVKEKYGDKVEIILFGGIYPDMMERNDGIHKVNQFLSYPGYLKHLVETGAHIGIAPLCENEFNMCKSNLRFIEYSAMGMATVASDIYPFAEDINAGMCTGVPVMDNFYDKLCEMVDLGAEELRKIGHKAQKYVFDKYTPQKNCVKLHDFIIGMFE